MLKRDMIKVSDNLLLSVLNKLTKNTLRFYLNEPQYDVFVLIDVQYSLV
jgi:hypothetical protein